MYTIYSDEDGSFIEEPVVAEISNHRVWAGSMCFGYGDFGKTVFLTKAEAETALAGLAGITSNNGQTLKGKENVSVWTKVADRLPPENKVVETKVEDSRGCRNVQPLMRKGELWFSPDGSIYVYYEPTHKKKKKM